MAPPITYLLDGVQYVTLMVGWGGAAGLVNLPGSGPVKRGFGRVLTFSLGANTKLDVPPFGHKDPPSPAIHMNATPADIHEGTGLYKRYCLYSCTDSVSSPAPVCLTFAMPPRRPTTNFSPSCWAAFANPAACLRSKTR